MFKPVSDTKIDASRQTYRQWGGVMDIILATDATEDPLNPASHQRMAVFTMQHIRQRCLSEGWAVSLDEFGLLQGEVTRLSVAQFFGFRFHYLTQKLLVPGDHSPFLNDCFYHDEPQNEQTAKTYWGTVPGKTFAETLADQQRIKQLPPYRKLAYSAKSYTDAFLDPPYSFGTYYDQTIKGINRRLGQEQGAFFLKMNGQLFGDVRTLFICEHSTDYSDYFNAGKEWWGSYLWTVYSPVLQHWVGIAASTTD